MSEFKRTMGVADVVNELYETMDKAVPKVTIRAVLDNFGNLAVDQMAHEGGRIRLGGLGTLYSIRTKGGMVNNPQDPTTQVESKPKLVARVTLGTHAKEALAKKDHGPAEKEEVA